MLGETLRDALLAYAPWVIGPAQLGALWWQGRGRTRARGYLLQAQVCAAMILYNLLTGQLGFVPIGVVMTVLAVRAYRDVRRSSIGESDRQHGNRDVDRYAGDRNRPARLDRGW